MDKASVFLVASGEMFEDGEMDGAGSRWKLRMRWEKLNKHWKAREPSESTRSLMSVLVLCCRRAQGHVDVTTENQANHKMEHFTCVKEAGKGELSQIWTSCTRLQYRGKIVFGWLSLVIQTIRYMFIIVFVNSSDSSLENAL